MSPTRTGKQTVRLRPRSELYVAIAVAAGIVLLTALLVWAMRPEDQGRPGTGGIITRQPRVALWLLLTLAVLAYGMWRVYSRPPRRMSSRNAYILVGVVVGVVALLAAFFWPGGLVKDYPGPTESPDIPADVTTPTEAGSTAPAATVPAATVPAATVPADTGTTPASLPSEPAATTP